MAKSKLQQVDLRSITRGSDTLRTEVTVKLDWDVWVSFEDAGLPVDDDGHLEIPED